MELVLNKDLGLRKIETYFINSAAISLMDLGMFPGDKVDKHSKISQYSENINCHLIFSKFLQLQWNCVSYIFLSSFLTGIVYTYFYTHLCLYEGENSLIYNFDGFPVRKTNFFVYKYMAQRRTS